MLRRVTQPPHIAGPLVFMSLILAVPVNQIDLHLNDAQNKMPCVQKTAFWPAT
jgi:hypothetical protein